MQGVTGSRRAAIQPALARMPARARAELMSGLGEFAAAAEEPPDSDLWAMGWTT